MQERYYQGNRCVCKRILICRCSPYPIRRVHEVLAALHDSVQHDLDQAAKRLGSASQSDTAVVVQPGLPGQIRTQ